jgi:hypothetical protein
MRKYILILLLLFNLSILNAQSNDCNSIVNFGDIEICLPNIVGMNECFSDPLVKINADRLKADDNEVILGIYLLDDIYKSRYNNFLENGFGNPYIKVYSTKLTKGVYVDESTLVELSSVIRLLFDNYEESSVKSNLESFGNDLNISFGKPLLLEEYETSPKIKSFVVLFNIKSGDENIVVTTVLNTLIIKNRLIFFAYYDEYTGMNDINKTKASNDYLALSLLVGN